MFMFSLSLNHCGYHCGLSPGGIWVASLMRDLLDMIPLEETLSLSGRSLVSLSTLCIIAYNSDDETLSPSGGSLVSLFVLP